MSLLQSENLLYLSMMKIADDYRVNGGENENERKISNSVNNHRCI